MISLFQLYELAEELCPGFSSDLPQLLTAWAMKDPYQELSGYLSGTGGDLKAVVKAMTPMMKHICDENCLFVNDCIRASDGGNPSGHDILLRLCERPSHGISKALASEGIALNKFHENIKNHRTQRPATVLEAVYSKSVLEKNILLKYGRDLTEEAKAGRFNDLENRPNEMEQMVDILLRHRKGNPAITGPAGVGKTALVELLARRIVTGEEEVLHDCRIFEISLGKMLAGTRYRGDFEERLESVMSTVQKVKPAIIFIDEMHLLYGAGRAEGMAMDASNLLKPYLGREEVKVIGATTQPEYQRYIAQDPALKRRFQELKIEEPSETVLKNIIRRQAQALMKHHGISIDEGFLERAVEMTNQHLINRYQPDKTIDLLDTAAVQIRRKGRNVLEEGDLFKTLSKMTRTPIDHLAGQDRISLKNLKEVLQSEIVGQKEAIERVSSAIIHRRMGLGREDRPLGVFLFAGAPGVGKTELARVLARTLFGGHRKLLHIDLAEYAGFGGINKLIGSPRGFSGSEEEGLLISGLQEMSSGVILFDEVEKASEEVQQLLLGLLDNGRICSSKGSSCDARQCVIILTTNALKREDLMKPPAGFGVSDKKRDIVELLKEDFPSEFLDRMDEIVPFRSLNHDDLKKILCLRLKESVEKLKKKSIDLVYEEARLVDHLLGFMTKKALGARDIARLLERRLIQLLSLALLETDPNEPTKVRIDDAFYKRGHLTISTENWKK